MGRHHHPNAHVSAVVYLSGDGEGREGSLCLHAKHQLNGLFRAGGFGGHSDHTPVSGSGRSILNQVFW